MCERWQLEARQVRVRVYHTFVPPVVGGDDVTPIPGRWTLHVEAVDATSRSDELVVRNETGTFPRLRSLTHALGTQNLSRYFRKISIQLDPHLHTDAFVEVCLHRLSCCLCCAVRLTLTSVEFIPQDQQ